mmetsp:Transcript_70088/g.164012  ORF Transcript_70088/g.164012 Transcript_70088/m.164012 type:complete len:243 (+) Transcript_70088:242-970(+)
MLEVHGPHGATRVDATEGPGIGVRCLDGCIHEGVVGWRQREAELVEQVGQDQPHFHLCEVLSQAAAGVVCKRREAGGLRGARGHGATHAGELLRGEAPPWVEGVRVCSPKLWVSMTTPVADGHKRALGKSDLAFTSGPELFCKLQLSEGAICHSRPQAKRLRDASVQDIKPAQVLVGWVTAIQAPEELVHFLLHLALYVRMAGELEGQPSHGVTCGVMARKEDQKQVPVVSACMEIPGLQGS